MIEEKLSVIMECLKKQPSLSNVEYHKLDVDTEQHVYRLYVNKNPIELKFSGVFVDDESVEDLGNRVTNLELGKIMDVHKNTKAILITHSGDILCSSEEPEL